MSGTNLVVYQPKKKNDASPSLQTFNKIIPPMDYSFCRIGNIADAMEEEPRYPVSPRGKNNKAPPEPEEGAKSEGRCIRLNNNNITSLESLIAFAQVKFTDWHSIAWIDLSQNEMTTIGPELTEFENLQILYLHGNQINDISNVDQLIPLKHLRKLTLHGNPMENVRGYRYLVLSKLPRLQSLDFSAVTKADRKTTDTWDKMHFGAKKKKKVISDDD